MTVPPEPPEFGLLFVCTGNICRSPTAERLTRRRLETGAGAVSGQIRVESAGTRAVVGAPVHPHGTVALRELGGDPEGFAARRLHRSMIAAADLVLTMTREHREAVLALEPRALSRTFTLREAAALVELLADAPDVGDPPGDRPVGLARRMAGARRLRVSDGRDDVTDPIGGSLDVHREVSSVIAECLDPVLDQVLLEVRARCHGGSATG